MTQKSTKINNLLKFTAVSVLLLTLGLTQAKNQNILDLFDGIVQSDASTGNINPPHPCYTSNGNNVDDYRNGYYNQTDSAVTASDLLVSTNSYNNFTFTDAAIRATLFPNISQDILITNLGIQSLPSFGTLYDGTHIMTQVDLELGDEDSTNPYNPKDICGNIIPLSSLTYLPLVDFKGVACFDTFTRYKAYNQTDYTFDPVTYEITYGPNYGYPEYLDTNVAQVKIQIGGSTSTTCGPDPVVSSSSSVLSSSLESSSLPSSSSSLANSTSTLSSSQITSSSIPSLSSDVASSSSETNSSSELVSSSVVSSSSLAISSLQVASSSLESSSSTLNSSSVATSSSSSTSLVNSPILISSISSEISSSSQNSSLVAASGGAISIGNVNRNGSINLSSSSNQVLSSSTNVTNENSLILDFTKNYSRKVGTLNQRNGNIDNDTLNITDPYVCEQQIVVGNVNYSGNKKDLNLVDIKIKSLSSQLENNQSQIYSFNPVIDENGDYQIDVKDLKEDNYLVEFSVSDKKGNSDKDSYTFEKKDNCDKATNLGSKDSLNLTRTGGSQSGFVYALITLLFVMYIGSLISTFVIEE